MRFFLILLKILFFVRKRSYMFISILKNMIIFFASFYFCDKINKSFLPALHSYVQYFSFSLLLAVIHFVIKNSVPSLSYFIPALCFFILFAIKQKCCSQIIFCVSLTSYVINILVFDIISFVVCSLLIIIPTNISSSNTITLIVCVLYAPLIIYNLKRNRLYKGISSLIFNGMLNYSTFACLLALTVLTFERILITKPYHMLLLTAIIVPICLFIILFWWRTQITKTYREKLRLLEMKTLRTAKLENETYIARLESENKRLGTIIHKDNRIVNAMADSVCDYLSSSPDLSAKSLQAKGQALSDEINSIKTYRQELLCQGSQSDTSIPQTNHAGVNAIISFMVKEASTYGISLKFHYDTDFFAAKRFTATEMDFVHLLSDLLENAVIATRHCNGKSIELSFQILKGTPAISVSDSGIPFEIDTYMKFGTCEASTHSDDGGTGIGLMDIWSFKKKYHASLVIEELDDSIYSKRLSLLFDNRNKYLVISNRHQEIVSCQTRSDLMVISRAENAIVELGEK